MGSSTFPVGHGVCVAIREKPEKKKVSLLAVEASHELSISELATVGHTTA